MSQEKLSREEMITLVRKIMRTEGTKAEQAADLALFHTNCTHPDGISLMSWPPGCPPTAEEIVDKAMSPAFRTWLETLHTFDPKRGAAPLRVPLPPVVSQAAPEQFATGGFRFSPDHPHYGSTYPHDQVTKAMFSPDFSHRAVTHTYDEWDGGLLWIDGECVEVPTDKRDYPLADNIGRWIDNHTFTIEVGGLEHPLADPRVNDRLGMIRGLLIYDAAQKLRVLALPGPADAWNAPVAVRDQETVLVYANADARDRQHAARKITLAPARSAS
jgi:hypothetical protein